VKPEAFLQEFFLEKMSKKEFNKIKNVDLLSNGILDSLDIVILSTKIKKVFNINMKINSQKTLNIFRSYNDLLKFLKSNK
tara:strand:- start:11 stop:250 length:240 start_codon:yes stop_codon:yes gene_type:complete